MNTTNHRHETLDAPVASSPRHTATPDDETDAHKRCAAIPEDECDKHLKCTTCPAYRAPGPGTRA